MLASNQKGQAVVFPTPVVCSFFVEKRTLFCAACFNGTELFGRKMFVSNPRSFESWPSLLLSSSFKTFWSLLVTKSLRRHNLGDAKKKKSAVFWKHVRFQKIPEFLGNWEKTLETCRRPLELSGDGNLRIMGSRAMTKFQIASLVDFYSLKHPWNSCGHGFGSPLIVEHRDDSVDHLRPSCFLPNIMFVHSDGLFLYTVFWCTLNAHTVHTVDLKLVKSAYKQNKKPSHPGCFLATRVTPSSLPSQPGRLFVGVRSIEGIKCRPNLLKTNGRTMLIQCLRVS